MELRNFIESLAREGLLQRVQQLLDWNLEIGEMTRQNQVPLLFENIKDYPGQALFTNGLSSFASVRLALRLAPALSRSAVIRKTIERMASPIPPVIASSGPAQEIIIPGPQIDFLKFPIPRWSGQDSGRYIGTWHINVTRDPDTGIRNLGVYRMQVLGPNRATVSTSPKSHLSHHFAKAEKEGKPLEMAVAIGVSESIVMAAASGYPLGSDEYDLAGALEEESVSLIRCGSVNLEVPATSEIVIEGFLQPGVRVQDGPYFDYAGKPTVNAHAYVFQATRLSHRKNPIFRGAAIGRPGAEDQQLFSVLSELNLFDFHGSRLRQKLQAQLIKRKMFKCFQYVGRISNPERWRGKHN
ncbi:MAG TPA: UbiD family decarboxylase [Candidatus Acidoferrales bacterium]|nr:UbiD family decarboxylase [Candidatus Acidoferrales bacterium]